MEISFFGEATIIMDLTALFILSGMIVYTSLYRKRGKAVDKLFFLLILADIVAVIADDSLFILAGAGITLESAAYIILFALFFLAVDVFSFLFCAYHMYRLEWEESRIKRTIPLLCVPELILIIILFEEILTGNFYSREVALAGVTVTIYDFLTFGPIILCGIFTTCISFEKNRQTLILIVLLLVMHIFLTMASVSTVTPLFLSLYLMYSHFLVMRDSFYGEDSGL